MAVEEAPERADPKALAALYQELLQFGERDVLAIRDRLHDKGAMRFERRSPPWGLASGEPVLRKA